MSQYNILIVEDDKDIGAMLTDYFTEEEYLVSLAKDGQQGLACFKERSFDIILLDLMLPKKSGVELLREIRKESFVPVIIISAKESDFDKSMLLELGADDYVTKPFSLMELNARMKSAIRRATTYSHIDEVTSASGRLTYKDITIEMETLIAQQKERELSLTATEFQILRLFLENPKKIFTKANIYQSIWNSEYLGDEDVINTQISRLRDKLSDDRKTPQYIETIWGIGYRLKGE